MRVLTPTPGISPIMVIILPPQTDRIVHNVDVRDPVVDERGDLDT
jgi:hypothetical protein